MLPKNRKYLSALKLAATNHLPPTLYTGAKGLWGRGELLIDEGGVHYPLPQSERTQMDVWLESGFQLYENAICPSCGVSAFYGRSEHTCIEFEPEVVTCHSCAVKEKYSKDHELGPGESVVVKPHGPKFMNDKGEMVADPLPPILEAMAKMP